MNRNNKEISWRNPSQILGMGGPWVGDLMIGGKQIADNVVVDNVIHVDEKGLIVFARYNELSKWAANNFFSIHCYDIVSQIQKNGIIKFTMVYLDSIRGDVLIVYDAFHNQDPSRRKTLKLQELFQFIW